MRIRYCKAKAGDLRFWLRLDKVLTPVKFKWGNQVTIVSCRESKIRTTNFP